jgi:DNA (cytosine-5)-methyltransferase 1
MRPRLLDLFCCQGGAAMGYHLAGFDVLGVDVNPQPRYPFRFVQADALQYLDFEADAFDVIHASPPCHDHTPLKSVAGTDGTDWLLPATRDVLAAGGKPYVIENVAAATMVDPITLCGGMFGLRTYRHRRFESNIPLVAPAHPKHVIRTATKQRRARWAEGWHVSITGDVGTYVGPEGLGIDWMDGNGLSQAIPPAYTQFIGEQLLEHVTERAA